MTLLLHSIVFFLCLILTGKPTRDCYEMFLYSTMSLNNSSGLRLSMNLFSVQSREIPTSQTAAQLELVADYKAQRIKKKCWK